MKTSRIELYINGVLQSSFPIYSDSVSIEQERERDEMFRRTKLNSTITFIGKDFQTIYNSSLDSSFEVKMYDVESNTFLARGTFEKTDCKFNLDDEICEVKISCADDYDKILAGRNNEYDIVALAPVREKIRLKKRAILQLYAIHDNKITNIIGNMSYEVNVSSGVEIDTITAENLEDDYNFSQLSFNQARLTISSMPAMFDFLVGDYYGEFEGEQSLFTMDGGQYGVNVRSAFTPSGKQVYLWQIINIDTGLPIGDGEGRILATQATENVKNPSSGIQFGYSFLADPSIWEKDSDMVSTYDERKIFGRILLDDISSSPIGEIKNIGKNDIVANNLNYHYSMNISDISLIAPLIVTSTTTQDAPTKWGVNGEGKYFVQPTPMNEGDNVIPIGWNRWIPNSFWFNSTTAIANTLDLFNAEWELNDAYPLWSVIQVLLKEIDPEITFDGTATYSQFLYGNISASVIRDYVKQLLYVTPITNVKKTYYNQAARKGKLTLGDIFDMLRGTCQLYWFIDSQKRLRIEHITWFKNGGNYSQASPIIDLTSIESPLSRKVWAFDQNTFDYDKGALVKRYEFGWADKVSEVFDGYPIDIHNRFVKGGKTYKASAGRFVSDIDLIMSAPDVLSDDNFALIGADMNKVCPIAEIGNLGMDFVVPNFKMQNPYLSFYFLELAYWGYDLGGDWASVGDFKTKAGMRGVYRVSDTKRAKKQTVHFPLGADKVGNEGIIRTGIGDGEWIKSEYTPEDGMTKMDLIMATKDDSLVSIGEFVGEGGITMSEQVNGFTLNGNQMDNGYGYVRVTANKDVRVTMLAFSEQDYDLGWEHTSPLISKTDIDNYATNKVSGNMRYVEFTLSAGSSVFFGYSKDSLQSGYADKIVVEFVAE